MKVIDLLVKIANKEELPKIVKYDDYLLIYDEDTQDYYNEPSCTYSLLNDIHYKLNDEVKIIEDTKEDKRIEKLDLEDDGNTITLFGEKENEWTILDNVDIIVCNKINEIIDKINGEENEN